MARGCGVAGCTIAGVSKLPAIPRRDPHGHKGTFGTVAVLGGAAHRAGEEGPGSVMVGGPAFAAVAALRSGCGLARLAMPEPVLAAGLSLAPSATGLALAVDHEGELIAHLASAAIDGIVEDARCLVIGPGLGVSPGAEAAVLRAVLQESAAVVVDADGLNNLAAIPEFQLELRAPVVLTPHVGEFRRLAAALGVTDDPVDAASRERACAAVAQKLGCIVVLKSAATVVSDGMDVWTHDAANPALATAGSGDVLAGLIGGLIAQFFRPEFAGLGAGKGTAGAWLSLFDCARLGVAAHSLAGSNWCRRTGATGGLVALDLANELPAVIEGMRRS